MISNIRSVLLFAAFALISLSPASAQALQPAKLAIINAQKAVADTQEIKKAQSALATKYGPRQQAITALQNQLQSIQQQLNATNLTTDKEAQLRADGTQKQKQLQRLSEDLQSDVNNERQDILGRAGRQMTEVVKKIAEQRGIDVVLRGVGPDGKPFADYDDEKRLYGRESAELVAGPRTRLLLPLNPAYGLILNFRQSIFGGPIDWYALSVSCCVSAVLLVVCCFYFRRVERSFADIT